MIHKDDVEWMTRMLGTPDLPAAVEHEYELRRGFMHRAGASGPIGVIALADMLRFLGCEPPAPAKVVQPSHWTSTPDGTVVEVLRDGEWRSGVFRGVCGQGTFSVQFGDKPAKLEFPGRLLRLPEKKPVTRKK